MTSSRHIAAAAFALACLSSAALAAANKIVHRTGACEKAASDWCTARSTQGGFTVMLPMAFNDYTVTEAGAEVTRSDTIGARTTDDITFMVTRIAYKNGLDAAKSRFEKFGSEDTGMGTLKSARHGKVGGQEARDLVFDGPHGVSHVRMVLLHQDVVMMIGFMTPAQEKAYPGVMDQFLGSLTITRP